MRDTAVQWYHKQIGFLFQQWHNHQITISEFHFKRLELQHQAKEIEKEQIGYSKEDVLTAGEMGEINTHDTKHIVSYLDEAKQFNETYGGNK
jgi:hypothetical protein